MTKSTITREQAQKIIVAADEVITALAGTNEDVHPDDSKKMCELWDDLNDRHAPPVVVRELARMALAAMDSSESVELPLDYLHGHKDGLELAAQLAEANHPETGDWLYDDPIELAKAIRKGPDMPPVQPVADSEPVIVVGDDGGDALSYRRLIQSFEPGTKLYRHAQPAPVVPDEIPVSRDIDAGYLSGWNDCRAAMLQVGTLTNEGTSLQDNHSVDDTQKVNSPVIPDGYVMVPKEPTADMIAAAMNCEDVLFNSDDSFCVQFGNIYKAMLAAAPHDTPTLNSVQSVVTAPGKWIPVSERMPDDDDFVYI